MITAIREISYGKSPHKGLCKRCCGMMRELPPKGEVQALHRSVPTVHSRTRVFQHPQHPLGPIYTATIPLISTKISSHLQLPFTW